jgi:glucose-fructose oxidoreductase
LEVNGAPPQDVRAGDPWAQFAAQVDGFSLAARTNVAHRTPGAMGLRDLKIMEACYRSADAGGAVVAVDIPV